MTNRTIAAVTADNMPASVNLDRFPDTCPMCNHGMSPMQLVGQYAFEQKLIHVVFRCPRTECQNLFIGSYRVVEPSINDVRQPGFRPPNGLFAKLDRLAPRMPAPPNIPEEVRKVSPTYVTIVGQVAIADSMNLDQLVGIGLRKALEFLIKDFTSQEHPTEAEAIRAATLGAVIKKYVDDSKLKSVATRAAWLGNDETHYIRKWESQDINDLRSLVKLTVNWIDSHLETKKYLGEMPVGK